MNITNEKGITLIALVITIIIMLILAGVTVGMTTDSGLFTKAKKSAFFQEVSRYKEELEEYTAIHPNRLNRNKITVEIKDKSNTQEYDNYKNEMKKYIPSFDDKYLGKFSIDKNQLSYNYTGNKKELAWAEELGLNIISE